ncbi:pyridoxine/pyridoxamine 5'-phosphate oxidase [Tenggerimyces flavus]|uniref:Pyridoxal 5'-phosphate synthase n=1 Tax=Tenggerimyces flavus TaxID=1708749 RepID=A0ABV7YBE8_9ACTN|nr:pyridoxal 5'-phosphate synthase [Tenggerimyces flavus]MBM7789101.1 pyridoxamine 5'-phosphate oxidase [Tenggerimyces flavus]
MTSEDLRALLRTVPTLTGTGPAFDPDDAPENPLPLFVDWLVTAIEHDDVAEPAAMTLSTVDANGRPSARVLILKNADEAGWQFASSALSRKGRELAQNGAAALTFYWVPLARQVRISGIVKAADPDDSANDFLARNESARAAAIASRQSEPLAHKNDLDRALAEVAARIEEDPTLTAKDWTLYTLQPDEIEFWQGDKNRQHQRLQYRRSTDGWRRTRLWP